MCDNTDDYNGLDSEDLAAFDENLAKTAAASAAAAAAITAVAVSAIGLNRRKFLRMQSNH